MRPFWRRRWAVATAAGLLLLLSAGAGVALFVQSATGREALERELSAVIGGTVSYQSLTVKLFPFPHAVILDAAIEVPGVVRGRLPELEIGVALLPLLAGHVRVAGVRAARPALEIQVKPGDARDPHSLYRETVGAAVSVLTQKVPGMTLSVSGGTVDLMSGRLSVLTLSDLLLDADVSATAVNARAECSSGLWQRAEVTARVTAGSLEGSAKLKVSGLRAQELLAAAVDEDAFSVRPGAVDANLEAETDGSGAFRGTLRAAAVQLALAHGPRVVELGPARISADAVRDGKGTAISLRRMELGALVPAATGSWRAADSGTAALELRIPALDLGRLLDAVDTLGGDLSMIRSWIEPGATGAVRDVAIAIKGRRDAGAAFDPASIRAEARFDGIALALRAAALKVRDGAGRFTLADGVLEMSELQGRIGDSSFESGALTAELRPAASLRAVRGAVDANLAEALDISRRVPGWRDSKLLAGIESLQGRAAGTVAYEARRKPTGLSVALEKVRGSARFRGLPLALEASRGELRYLGGRIVVKGWDGTFGRSQVQGAGFDLVLGPTPKLNAASGGAVVVLDDFHPWLASLEGMRQALGGVKSATGQAAVQVTRLAGPVSSPAALEFDATVRPQQVRVEAGMLPAPLVMSSGAAVATQRSLKLDRVVVATADSRATVSGEIRDYTADGRVVELALTEGSLGQELLDWLRERWEIPPQRAPHAPVGITGAQVRYAGGEQDTLAVQGSFVLPGAVNLELDAFARPHEFELRHLALKDAASDFAGTFKWQPDSVELSFKGRFDNRTFERILKQAPSARGSIQGDFRATLDLREPRRSIATGTLDGDDLGFLLRWDLPVTVDRVRLTASGEKLRLDDGALLVAGQRVALSGSLERRPETFALDARVVAEKFDVDRFLAALPSGRPEGTRGRAAPGDGWSLPVEGQVVWEAGAVTYGKREFEKVAGTAKVEPKRIVAEVRNAGLCGLALPATIVLVPGDVSLRGRIEARGQPLERALPCLEVGQVAMTGTFDLDASYSASGPYDGLARVAQGSFKWTARNGKINRAKSVTNVLSLDDVAKRLDGGAADVIAGGLQYREIVVAGALDAGQVRVETFALDSATIGAAMSGEVDLVKGSVDLHGLVAPFGGSRTGASHIPLVGSLLGTRIVVVPVRVSGELHDPQVDVAPAGMVGRSVLNLMGAVLKAPVELLDFSSFRSQ